MANESRLQMRLKRWISITALGAMVWSGVAVWGGKQAAAATNPFSDVASGHWAEKHITKLYMQNVISGKGDGIFDPSGNVRREDAVIMALGFKGLGESIKKTSIAFPSTFEVDDYAKPWVNEAFNRNILSREEEYSLAIAESGQHWGRTFATREWAAKLLIRAVGKEEEAIALAGRNTNFADDESIDPEMKPYVLAAVNLGLVAGIEETVSGVKVMKFQPKTHINRASLATLFSKAESLLDVAYPGQVSGVLMGLEDGKATILHDDGSLRDYALSANVMYAIYNNDKPVASSALTQYSKVILIHDADGNIGYVEQMDHESHISTVEGAFDRLAEGRIYVTVDGGFQSYAYDAAKLPKVTDAEGRTAQLEDIPQGASVRLKVNNARADQRVFEVFVNQSMENRKGYGIVSGWQPSSGVLQLSDPATGTTEELIVPPQAEFVLEDTPIAQDKLLVGDSITYEVRAGILTKVMIDKRLFETVHGRLLQELNAGSTIANILVNGDLQAFYLSDKTVVSIEGMSSAGLTDLQVNDELTLTVEADTKKITKIAVTNRNVRYLTGVTVAGYLSASKTLSVIDASGKVHNFVLGNSVRYDSDGVSLTLNQAESRFTAGKKITIAYSGDHAITVYFVTRYNGTVLENDFTARMMKLQTDDGNTITLNYPNYFYVDAYGTGTSIADIRAGDYVSVMLNDNQDQIQSIRLRKNVQLEIVSVDALNNRVRVRTPGTTETPKEWSIPSSVTIYNESGAAIPLAGLAPGMVLNFTFDGSSTITKIKIVTIIYGQVKSINLHAATLEIGLPDGKTVTRSVGFTPTVRKNGAYTNTLATVQVGDRVELRTSEGETTEIEIVTPVDKTFWKYNNSTKLMEVRRSSLNENNTYKIESDTYIHHGGTKLTIHQLKDGDAISIYILRDKVVEISKK